MRKLSFTTAKFVSSLTIAAILISAFCLARVSTLKQIRDYGISHYDADFNKIKYGYTEPFGYVFRNYGQFIAYVYNSGNMDNEDADGIFENLRRKPLMSPQFFEGYGFISVDGRAWFSEGDVVDFSSSPIFRKISAEAREVFVTDAFVFGKEKTDVVALVEKVYGKQYTLKGYVCALIQVSGLRTILDAIQNGIQADVILLDSEGTMLFRKNQLEDKFDDDPTYTFYPIERSPWRLGIRLPKRLYLDDFYKQRNMEIIFLFVVIVVIVGMLTAELFIFQYLQKRELVMSSYDHLTGMWTRQRFEARARSLMRRNSSSKIIVIEADIRGFKFINQNYGCYQADNIIRLYGAEIQKMAAALKGWCARGYADHFYIFAKIDSVRSAMKTFTTELDRIAEKAKEAEPPFFVKFGLSFYLPSQNGQRETIESLIGQASFAKSSIKDDSITNYSIYNSRTAEKIKRERSIEARMEKALENHEFYVVYQPKIQLSTEKIVGAEALVRWKSSDFGLLSPDQFIPLFEKNGFVKKLDFYVYEEVFKFLRYLKSQNLPLVPVSINMSRKHNSPDRFIHDFMEIFNRYDISPELVQVELLEHSVMEKTDLVYTTELLHREGFTVAMDDFGTGESSLTMLSKIPVDVLKFDKSFLQESDDIDPKTKRFIRGLIEISKELNKMTVFEGVETEAQKNFLKENNCDLVQGYYYSKPLEQSAFEKFLVEHV